MPPPVNRAVKGKRQRVCACRDECECFVRRTFNIEHLPIELQEMILIEAAVTRRIAGDTMDEVKRILASVCSAWREIVSAERFNDRVQEIACLRGNSLSNQFPLLTIT